MHRIGKQFLFEMVPISKQLLDRWSLNISATIQSLAQIIWRIISWRKPVVCVQNCFLNWLFQGNKPPFWAVFVKSSNLPAVRFRTHGGDQRRGQVQVFLNRLKPTEPNSSRPSTTNPSTHSNLPPGSRIFDCLFWPERLFGPFGNFLQLSERRLFVLFFGPQYLGFQNGRWWMWA